ncbi:uncharacterized protein ASCRUDRAFT_67504 [Ascoidea rubescens DSM 1968]|uniref:Uncharacterized protein n=1 Tax=Ascoidea rubescens DSM 1968 TaxID=1344418 RepID=A0A1D2VP70_9ASCO|nr:hypothetical protein ASCRUDRAFT_67504 [Ascoidea rubescens DSM 1968]ODV63396.1 hypothetical protein ASCRUDRAFT_67504 [Ascoidea rubescens DSM 1968]
MSFIIPISLAFCFTSITFSIITSHYSKKYDKLLIDYNDDNLSLSINPKILSIITLKSDNKRKDKNIVNIFVDTIKENGKSHKIRYTLEKNDYLPYIWFLIDNYNNENNEDNTENNIENKKIIAVINFKSNKNKDIVSIIFDKKYSNENEYYNFMNNNTEDNTDNNEKNFCVMKFKEAKTHLNDYIKFRKIFTSDTNDGINDNGINDNNNKNKNKSKRCFNDNYEYRWMNNSKYLEKYSNEFENLFEDNEYNYKLKQSRNLRKFFEKKKNNMEKENNSTKDIIIHERVALAINFLSKEDVDGIGTAKKVMMNKKKDKRKIKIKKKKKKKNTNCQNVKNRKGFLDNRNKWKNLLHFKVIFNSNKIDIIELIISCFISIIRDWRRRNKIDSKRNLILKNRIKEWEAMNYFVNYKENARLNDSDNREIIRVTADNSRQIEYLNPVKRNAVKVDGDTNNGSTAAETTFKLHKKKINDLLFRHYGSSSNSNEKKVLRRRLRALISSRSRTGGCVGV